MKYMCWPVLLLSKKTVNVSLCTLCCLKNLPSNLTLSKQHYVHKGGQHCCCIILSSDSRLLSFDERQCHTALSNNLFSRGLTTLKCVKTYPILLIFQAWSANCKNCLPLALSSCLRFQLFYFSTVLVLIGFF